MTYIKCLEGDKQGKHGEEKLYGKKKKKERGGLSRKLSIRQNSCWDLKEKK